MKLIIKIMVFLMVLYALLWGGLAAYFSYAERDKDLLESNLSRLFDRPVTIEGFNTVWQGLSPGIHIKGFRVQGDIEGQPALAFKSLFAEINPLSLLRLWPCFTKFVVERPVVEIVSLDPRQLQVAGIRIKSSGAHDIDPPHLISWLMGHESVSWLNGEVVWRRLNGEIQHYKDVSFLFQRERENRVVNAAVTTDEGALAFTAEANGNVFADNDWDASLEVLGNQSQPLLSTDDLSLKVEDGDGRLRLSTLDIEHIRDFIQLTGLANNARWLLEAQLSGRLHDVEFGFSGPLLDISNWSLKAAASGLGFNSIGSLPAMTNLNGELEASAFGGEFLFSTRNSVFEWSRWFDRGFPITKASGEFIWSVEPDSGVEISLKNGEFTDINTRISNVNANIVLNRRVRRVSSFGDLFKVDSVVDLSYEGDDIVIATGVDHKRVPVMLDASADFEINRLSELGTYLPNDQSLMKFRQWWSKAVISGRGFNGKASYRGELSTTALDNGKAVLNAAVDFDNIELDYGYQQAWPVLKKSAGKLVLLNDVLTISPSSAEAMGEPVRNSEARITSFFSKDRSLELHGEMIMSLTKGMEFLFKGPLIHPRKKPKILPIKGQKGTVEIVADVVIPLNKVNDATVKGTAKINDGVVLLPEGVPVENIQALVNFTERNAHAEGIRARFLGGETRANLVTVKEAQPPVMKIVASGNMQSAKLEPWVGEHLLTWFTGQTAWQGTLLLDGPRVEISGESDLTGIEITAPAPLTKSAEQASSFAVSMLAGSDQVQQELSVNYEDLMFARMRANRGTQSALFDQALISIGKRLEEDQEAGPEIPLKDGVHIDIQQDDINMDDWLSAIIDIAQHEPKNPVVNTAFLDSMRSVTIRSKAPVCLGREFGELNVSVVSEDGYHWIGMIKGENIQGSVSMQPRADISEYAFNLSYLNLREESDTNEPPSPVDYHLKPEAYPVLELTIDKFVLTNKSLGRLELMGKPVGAAWETEKFEVTHNGIHTSAHGRWVNSEKQGSISSFDFSTKVEEAEGVLDDMEFDGFIRKGEGFISGNVKWIGAPHEFDYARLNGNFDMRIKDGELVKVEPGGGKLLGLLNFNAIARRLTFDFSDVFASGLKFDRMQYTGVFADGEAVMREAYIFTPAVFVSMEGKVDLDKELIDMEIHISPELGGNLTLLSALANPTAGAVLFLTQQIFKDDLRSSSFKSYRALGTWEDFEMVEFKSQDQDTAPASQATSNN